MTLPAGTHLGPYEIVGPLGRGGMGEVYRAFDPRLERFVALKVLPDVLARDRDSLARFEREARAASALNHPHIVNIYEIADAGDCRYIAMELVEGQTLREAMGAHELRRLLPILTNVADALAAAHAAGIVHRDLKPENILVTRDGYAKLVDFGLAKVTLAAGIDANSAPTERLLTGEGVMMGTVGYMSPEQIEGKSIDHRSDIFSFGCVLYEAAARQRPFEGNSTVDTLHKILHDDPPALNVTVDTPVDLYRVIRRCLAKDCSERYQSMQEVSVELRELSRSMSAVLPAIPAVGPLRRPAVLVPVALVVLLTIAGGIQLYQQTENRRWAREDAIPEITRLTGEMKPLAAFQVLLKAERYLPGDQHLAEAAHGFTRFTSVKSSRVGATVKIQDYLDAGGPWLLLGTTPIEHVRIPAGYFRWRLAQPGGGEFVAAPVTEDLMQFGFEPSADVSAGMVHIPGGPWGDMVGFVGWVNYQLPAFDMDRFEVTNREYQQFVDQGGYQKRDYWKEKFVKDGKELTWEQAMDFFRDPTGRSGPSTWEGGHFPQGQAEHPVSGVSWYEATAYEAFVGKSLPALGEWFKAAPVEVASYTINQSNFGGGGAVPVGTSQAVGPYGTYDLVGNVREWCLNAVDGDKRFILGGAWGTQTYQAYEPEALPPFDRSALNGFRGVRNSAPMPTGSAAPVVRQRRNFFTATPASDQVFQIYKAVYAYDKRPLNAAADAVIETTADWTKQKITIDAGYQNERLPMYLFLPKNVQPPYQAVVFFPSARVNTMKSSETLGDMDFVDYVIKSGRALVYPIYRETYERRSLGAALPGDVGDREMTIQQSKEVRRAVDYLETRLDIIDTNKLAYLGVSQGSAYGVIYMALDDRFKAIVFLDGGFFLGRAVAGRDQVDFAPRIKQPLLMVNGKYDFTFPLDQSQLPMFEMIGTAPADKFREVLETSHNVSQLKPELSRKVLWFLDKYLDRVK